MQKFVQDFRSDLRYAARWLRRSPGFTAAAIVTIALGIGVNAGIFSVLNGVLFREIPAQGAHQLVSISQTVRRVQGPPMESGPFTTAEYRAYRDRALTLSGVLAHSNYGRTMLGGDTPRQVLGGFVSCNYFTVLEQHPALGRGLNAEDCEPGAPPVVVLAHELWSTTFAASSEILGRSVELNRQSFTVVGVATDDTYSASPFEIGYFAPLSAEPLLRPNESRYQNENGGWLNLIGRRRPEAGLEQVRADLGVIAAQIDQQYPGRSTAVTIERATPIAVPAFLRRAATGVAAVLMAAFGLVLLIACANVANLLLARGMARSREIGIRLSLGASRARVVRLLLTESMLISLTGGLLGSAVALSSFQALIALTVPALMPPEFPILVWDVSPDYRVLSFALALTFATSILSGLAPALQVSKPDLQGFIKQDSAGAVSSGGGRLRGTLVGIQVALCMSLMIATGLLLRGMYATYTTDPGFEYRGVANVPLQILGEIGYKPEEAAVLRRRLMENIKALPGVDAVAYVWREPLGGDAIVRRGGPIRLPGRSEGEVRWAEMNVVTSAYFSVLGIPIRRGRTFTEAEVERREGDTFPAIVSETTARNLWPEEDPIGRTLLQGGDTLRVVGVARDAQVKVLGEIPPYYVYVPGEARTETLLVKSHIDFGSTASAIRSAVRDLDPALVVDAQPLAANLTWQRGLSETVTTIGAGLGVLALVLASVGIYGVVSYSVTRRYREIGIRMALGAGSGNVLGLILGQTMRPVVVGAVIGIAAALTMSRILTSVLFGVSPVDPIGLGGASLLVLGVALAASVMAAVPVTRADPTAALRHE